MFGQTSYVSECNQHFFCLEDVNSIYIEDNMVHFALASSHEFATVVKVQIEDFTRLYDQLNEAGCFVKLLTDFDNRILVNAFRFSALYKDESLEKNWPQRILFVDGSRASHRIKLSDVKAFHDKIMPVKRGDKRADKLAM
ncbi:MAG: hypothetical protein CMP22_05030 [Rickettsiales bacterium]|nr:hypothetical protein [Rickettsiales bacterium]|tara:strand:- start:434 stop:853 length:420 start_codon:yes stop_codon:yes gene_type:complete